VNLAALFSVDGRETRLGFWRLYLSITAVTALVWCASLFAIIGLGPWAGFALLALLPLGAMMSALVVRRVHDRGKNALWALFFVFGPLVLTEPAQSLAANPNPPQMLAALGLSMAGLALSIWSFIEIGMMKGSAGANRYGPDPSAGEASEKPAENAPS
jgi:uncharacterized membrane protein YhaH (DUF805 family)